MKIVKRMILPLALIAGAVACASMVSRVRRERLAHQAWQRRMALEVWEAEGGSPAPARPRSQSI